MLALIVFTVLVMQQPLKTVLDMGLMSLIDNKNLEKKIKTMSVEFSSYNYVFCANICKEIPFMAYSHNLFILDFDHYFTFL